MIKFLYHCYNINSNSKSFFGKYSAKVIRKLTLVFSSIIFPLYCFIIRHFFLSPKSSNENKIIVTFTSFPARIKKVYQVVISLMLQSNKPDKIVLYLSKEQFTSIDDVPLSLKQLVPYGLEIIFVDNDLRSYKKYIYNKNFLKNENFIIVDDDIIYHPDMIKTLLKTAEEFPKSVCANRCVTIEKDKKYQEWKLATKKGIGNHMATGCAGVYYQVGTLDDMAYDMENAWITCPNGDDIWLKASSIVAESEVIYTGFSQLLLPILNNNAFDLHVENVEGNRNNINIENVKKFLEVNYKKELFC